MSEVIFSAFVLALLALGRQSFIDIIRNEVDSRWSWVVFGFCLALGLRAGLFFEVLIVGVLFFFVFGLFNKTELYFGDGDREIITFVLMACLLINGWLSIVLFGLGLLVCWYVVIPFVKKWFVGELPLVPFIMASFLFSQYWFIDFVSKLTWLF